MRDPTTSLGRPASPLEQGDVASSCRSTQDVALVLQEELGSCIAEGGGRGHVAAFDCLPQRSGAQMICTWKGKETWSCQGGKVGTACGFRI